jgi:hypothetical protein
VYQRIDNDLTAYSPQAKERIERSFLTAQDRLVKQMRLAKISTLEAANDFLEDEYWPEWNARFAQPVQDFADHHRALTKQLELTGYSVSCGTASDWQRLHVFFRWPAQSDCSHRSAKWICGVKCLGVELRLSGAFMRSLSRPLFDDA